MILAPLGALSKKPPLQMKLSGGSMSQELGMFERLKKQIEGGMPVLATCAGLILLASDIENDDRQWFGTLPVTVRRNAYGRQLGSFYAEQEFAGIGTIPMTFIRAPYIASANPEVDIMAEVDGHIVGVRYGYQLAISFHPELNSDRRIHEYFIRMTAAVKNTCPDRFCGQR